MFFNFLPDAKIDPLNEKYLNDNETASGLIMDVAKVISSTDKKFNLKKYINNFSLEYIKYVFAVH